MKTIPSFLTALALISIAALTHGCESSESPDASAQASGDQMSVEDLIEGTSCEEYDCFRRLVSSYRFAYAETTNDESSIETHSFIAEYTRPVFQGKPRDAVAISFHPSEGVAVKLSTSSIDYYNELMDQMQTMEFVSVGSEQHPNGAMITTYNSVEMQKIEIYVSEGRGQYGGVDLPWWQVVVARLP